MSDFRNTEQHRNRRNRSLSTFRYPMLAESDSFSLQDQQKMAKVGLEMKLLTSEVDAEAEKWDEYAEVCIVHVPYRIPA